MLKIKVYLEEQVSQGNLIKGYWEERNWLGFHVVVRMLTSYIQSAVQSGCQNWDNVILKCLGVALVVACCSRSGDIAKSGRAPSGMSCLTWKCVELEVVTDDSGAVEKIRAMLTLKFTKGHKLVCSATIGSTAVDFDSLLTCHRTSLNEDKVVFIDNLTEAKHSCACAVKLLLSKPCAPGAATARRSTKCSMMHWKLATRLLDGFILTALYFAA